MTERSRRVGKNPWGVRFGESDEAVLEVWVKPDGQGFDHCFHPGNLPWSSDEVVDRLRAVVLGSVDDGKRLGATALVTVHVDLDSAGCGHGSGHHASPSVRRPRFEVLNEALRVLGLSRMKSEVDH